MKIALDAAAGDNGAAPNIEGAILAANSHGLKIALVGPAKDLEAGLRARSISPSDPRFEIVDAPEVIAMGEEPAAACRAKPRASIMACALEAASGRADGLVTAGHSGAAMVACLWHLKRIPGVLRPAVAAILPTLRGRSVLLDAGANAECKPWHLLQFAVMGSAYARAVLGIKRPSVGLLSNGAEDSKGNDLVKEALPLLKCSGLNFRGPVEGQDVPEGRADVIVCDGFIGNVTVKVMEGTGAAVFTMLKAELGGKRRYRVGGLLLRGPLRRLKSRMSYDEYGGAPLLGVGGNAVIAHGRSNARAIANALRLAAELAKAGINDRIQEGLAAFQTDMEPARGAPKERARAE